jgi:hypothetical protein
MQAELLPPHDIDWDEVMQLLETNVQERLQSDTRFTDAKSFREQCYWIVTILREETKPSVPYRIIGAICHISETALRKNYKKFVVFQNVYGDRGRPSILLEPQIEAVVMYVEQSYHNQNPETTKSTQRFLQENFNVTIYLNTLHQIIL